MVTNTDTFEKWSKVLAIVVTLLIQSAAIIWWASSITNRMTNMEKISYEHIEDANKRFHSVYTKEETIAALAQRDQRIMGIEKQIDVLARQTDNQLNDLKDLVQSLNNKMDNLIFKIFERNENTKSK